MRSISSAVVILASPSDLEFVDMVFIESADPVDMQQRVAVALAAHPNVDWALTHVDLAGGGDGHTFVCTLGFATAEIGSGGAPPENTNLFFYMASEASALAVARTTVNPQIAALFSAPISADRVDVDQTLMAGAAKGTRFMGCVLTVWTRLG
jgi:hypothetical protein